MRKEMSGDYCRVVRDAVMENWKVYRVPLHYDVDDYRVGTELLTKLALEHVAAASAHEEKEPPRGLKRHRTQNPPEDPRVEKIKLYVEDKAYRLFNMYKVGFPFAYVEASALEAALRRSFETHSSILAHFSPQDQHSEELMERCLANLFCNEDIRLGLEVCVDLKRSYLKGNHQAGYYLLWIIKQTGGCSFNIPAKESFTHSTVAEVFSQFFADQGTLDNTPHFINILLHSQTSVDETLYRNLFPERLYPHLLGFATAQLAKIPMGVWPRKGKVILDRLERMPDKNKLSLATTLMTSQDPLTQQAGKHIRDVLTSRSLNTGIPHLYGLQQIFPDFGDHCSQRIFKLPFRPFRNIFGPIDDPAFTRRLSFNCGKNVFVHHSLMIGLNKKSAYNGDEPDYLLAYDMHSEKMVWGIPLTNPKVSLPEVGLQQYSLGYMDGHIALQSVGDKNVYFINPQTGDISDVVETSYAPQNIYQLDWFHKSREGYTYQVTCGEDSYILIGSQQARVNFEARVEGDFLPLSTHCGFIDRVRDGLVLFGPTGDKVVIPRYRAAQAVGNKLYLIERDSEDKNKCHLTLRNLNLDHTVVSDVEQSFVLNVPKAFFGKVCQNGQVILFSNSAPIFINLQSGEVVYGPYAFPYDGKHVISDYTGDVWSWDPSSKNIYKTSATQRTLMGSMSGGQDTSLVHVDENDQLYFAR
jgi:hypothetical protein